MRDPKQDVKADLLASAKREFLEKGYAHASLRRICEGANVTTGALYFFFRNKEELFESLVEKPVREFQALYREACILLLDKSDGTKYSAFLSQYREMLEGTFGLFFRKYGGGEYDPALVHLIASMRIHGYLELLCGNYSEPEIRRLAGDMGIYADAGFAALMEKERKRQ